MSHPQSPQQLSLTNGIGRRRIEKDGLSRSDNLNWRQPARTLSNSSFQDWSKGIHERLFYMHTCLIGQHVEVQKIDGHVYSGIFHDGIVDKEYGVILKMARLIKEGAHCIQGDSVRQAARHPPKRTYVISGKDFVQIVAKDVSLSGDALANSRVRENHSELVTDAVVSQVWHRESERELKPWKPDDEFSDPTSINLSNTWRSRNWDQFEANKALFGVETTFDEELYTTKLVRGPQLREREREAHRIALEILGQQTRNVHLAEERGIQLAPELEAMDEESKYSSVGRGYEAGDDDDDQHMNDHNDETFGGSVARICGSTFQNNSSSTLSDDFETSLSCADPQNVIANLRAGNYRDRQDLPMLKEDGGSPDSSSDFQKEHLRLRKLLVGDKSKHCNKGSGSPYNSPIGRGSPLLSPLAGDAAGIKALNLDSSCPQVPDDVYRGIDLRLHWPIGGEVCGIELFREFNEFKQQKQLEALKALSESFKKELEPRSPASLPTVSASKKSPLNVNAKVTVRVRDSLTSGLQDFKLNPNAQSFTPSSCSVRASTPVSQHALATQSPMYMHSIVHGGSVMQSSPVNLQSTVQQNQLSPFNPAVASAVVAVNSTAFMSSPGGPVPGFPVGGVGILPGQPNPRAQSHTQQQAMSSYGQPQQVKYHPPTSALQAGLLHPNGQLYSQHMMYGQPASPVVYVPFPQGMMQAHSVPPLGQGRLCSQPHQNQPQSR